MATTKSDYFLLDGNSFYTETDVNSATVIRSGVGKALTQTEKDTAGAYYNATKDEISYAQIYNLAFGANFLNQLGGSDEWMAKALSDPKYKDAFKKATGKTGPNINFAAAKDAEKLWEPSQQNKDANGNPARSRRSPTLRYPLNESRTVKYDYMQVVAYEHEANTFANQSSSVISFTEADDRIKTSVGRVFLPMQPGLSEGNGVDWGPGTANPFEAAGFNIAQSAITKFGNAKDGEAFAGAAKQTMEQTITAGKQLLGGVEGSDIASYFAGQAVGKNSLFTRATGKVLNPNLELLFTGPRLRSFNYEFRFTPREKEEARVVKRIIKFFKKNMAPQRVSSKLFLMTPNVFKLKYIYKNGLPHPYLNKIKTCALTSFNVDYTPDGSYMTYDDGSMTSYNVSMSFGELNPIYEDEIDEYSNDMGF